MQGGDSSYRPEWFNHGGAPAPAAQQLRRIKRGDHQQNEARGNLADPGFGADRVEALAQH